MRFKEALFWIGLTVAVLCVWVLVFWLPVQSRIESKKRELADVEAQLARIGLEVSRPTEMKTEGNSRTGLTSVRDEIPHLDAFPDFIRRLALSMRHSGVTIDRLNGRFHDGNGKGTSALVYPVTEIDFTGRFLDVGQALEQIQGVKAYRRIIRAQIIARDDGYPDLKGNVEIEFKAWRD